MRINLSQEQLKLIHRVKIKIKISDLNMSIIILKNLLKLL